MGDTCDDDKGVSPEEGTGIVHIAPGCGEEDFQLGKEFGLAVIAPLDEAGIYVDGFGWPDRPARRRRGAARSSPRCARRACCSASQHYRHCYPHCWRCNTELVFRLVDEWYISMDELRRA